MAYLCCWNNDVNKVEPANVEVITTQPSSDIQSEVGKEVESENGEVVPTQAENNVESENVDVITNQPVSIDQPTNDLNKENQKKFYFTKLPSKARHEIISYLNPTSLAHFARCSKDCELESRKHLPVKLVGVQLTEGNNRYKLELYLHDTFSNQYFFIKFISDSRTPGEYTLAMRKKEYQMKGDALVAGYRYLLQNLQHIETDIEEFPNIHSHGLDEATQSEGTDTN